MGHLPGEQERSLAEEEGNRGRRKEAIYSNLCLSPNSLLERGSELLDQLPQFLEAVSVRPPRHQAAGPGNAAILLVWPSSGPA